MKAFIGVQNIGDGGKIFITLNQETHKFGNFESLEEKAKCLKYLKEFYKHKGISVKLNPEIA